MTAVTSNLPGVVWQNVFLFLPTEDVKNCELVSKQFREACGGVWRIQARLMEDPCPTWCYQKFWVLSGGKHSSFSIFQCTVRTKLRQAKGSYLHLLSPDGTSWRLWHRVDDKNVWHIAVESDRDAFYYRIQGEGGVRIIELACRGLGATALDANRTQKLELLGIGLTRSLLGQLITNGQVQETPYTPSRSSVVNAAVQRCCRRGRFAWPGDVNTYNPDFRWALAALAGYLVFLGFDRADPSWIARLERAIRP